MKRTRVARICVIFFVVFLMAWNSPAQTNSPDTVAAATNNVDFLPELTAVTKDLKEKFQTGRTNKAELDASLNDIDDLIVKHKQDGNKEQLARLYLLDAHIYADGFKDTAKARAIWGQVERDFPGTLAARGAAASIEHLDAEIAAAAGPNVPEGLEIGQKFPGFAEADLAGKPLSLADYKGKVTLIDFWGAWCPPSRWETPGLVALYNRYHAQGFDIVGVNLDDDKEVVVNFTQAQGMVWSQYFDGQGWDNKLAMQYGVQNLPMNYLLDAQGVIIGEDLHGDDLAAAVAKAMHGR
jgi:thiol-disulfide isomerase/thioredoxin